MTMPLTLPPRYGHKSLLFSEVVTDLDNLKADVAFLGIPYGAAYSVDDFSVARPSSDSNSPGERSGDPVPRTLRLRYRGPFHMGRNLRVVDCGDVPADLNDRGSHLKRAEIAVRKILAAGAMPIVLGGDHAMPIPVLRASRARPNHAGADRPTSTGATR